jgi:hypothetical protein
MNASPFCVTLLVIAKGVPVCQKTREFTCHPASIQFVT